MIEGNPDPTPGTVFIFANLAGGQAGALLRRVQSA